MHMQFHEMKEIDLKLTLLSGSRIKLENLEIIPYTLNEIREFGYSKYMQNLQWVSLTIDDFIGSILDLEKRIFLEQQKKDLKAFDFYVKLGGLEMQERLLSVLKMILKTDDVRMLNDRVIAIDFVKLGIIVKNEDGNFEVDEEKLKSLNNSEIKVVHRDNFDDIIKIVKFQNYLEQPQGAEEEESVADEEARKLLEHMKKMQEKVEEKKKQQKEDEEADIDIADIISAVSSKSNSINKLNIWDFTLYQIYDEYARLELIDNYDFSIKAMMAGAKKVDLKHWSSKLS